MQPLQPTSQLPTTKAAEIAEGAVEALERYGWMRGDYGDTRRGFCLIGALSYAASTSDSQLILGTVGRVLADAILSAINEPKSSDLYGGPYVRMTGNATVWNDTQETVEPVIDVLKHAAKDLRNRAGVTDGHS